MLSFCFALIVMLLPSSTTSPLCLSSKVASPLVTLIGLFLLSRSILS